MTSARYLTSSSVLYLESDILSADMHCAGDSPSAVRTYDGSVEPAEHADAAETAIPSLLSLMTVSNPFPPSNLKWVLLHSLLFPVGLGTAAELAMSTMDDDVKMMTRLRDEIIDDMLKIDGAHLNGPTGKRRLCNNTHFRFDGAKGLDTVIKLSKEGIAASAASACSAGSNEPSYVLTSLGLSPEQCLSALRISLSRYNTEEDVKYLAEVMRRI